MSEHHHDGMASGPTVEEQTLAQVRELLFGASQRDLSDRTIHLERLMREAEARLQARIQSQMDRLEAVARETDMARRAQMRAIGEEMAAMGARLQQMADDGEARAETDNVHHLNADSTNG